MRPVLSHVKTIIHQTNRRIRKLFVLALGILSLGFAEFELKAQQYNRFSTGVNLRVVRQPGATYFNLAQQQFLQAMRQRQNAFSNIGTAYNLQAARLNAQRQQIQSVRRAQIAQMQAQLHLQNAMRLRVIQQQQASRNFFYGRR